MKKHLLSLMLAIVAGTQVICADAVQIGSLYYNLDAGDRTAAVTNHPELLYSGVINIPSTVTSGGTTYTVTTIEGSVFWISTITKVTIPETVTFIGACAFASNTIKEIIWNARNCTVTGSIFYHPESSNVEKLTFGSNVESIPAHLCDDGVGGVGNLPKLKSIIIPNSVTSIGDQAFYGCSSITAITIGTGLQTIGEEALWHLDSLRTIRWNAISCDRCADKGFSLFYRSSIGTPVDTIFFGSLVEYIPQNFCPSNTNIQQVTIPESVKSIGADAFMMAHNLSTIYWNAKNCADLEDEIFSNACSKNIILGNKVTRIPALLCSGLTNLTAITIPNSVTSIGRAAFYGSGLTNIVIPNSITTIGDQAFQKCENLQNVTWSNKITTIGQAAFAETGLIGSMTIPNSVTVIESNAFDKCNGLNEVTIPSGVSSIKGNAFNCDSLHTIHILANTPPVLENRPFKVILKQEVIGGTLSITYVRILIPKGTLSAYQNEPTWSYYIDQLEEDNNGSSQTQYTVIFKDWDGTVLKTQQVNKGQSATAPANPTRDGYTFTGWDRSFTNVQSDIIVTALYTPNGSGNIPVTGVSLNKKTLQIGQGRSQTLTATISPANATNKTVIWTSSNTAVAPISNTGKITAKTAGVSTISCETEDGHFKAECYIVVTDPSYGCDYSYEPTAATVIHFEATNLSLEAFEGGIFVILEDASYVLNLMYYGSFVNGILPIGNHSVSSIEQNGNILYSIGGDETNDYGSFLATDFTADGYSTAYYVIAGNVSVGTNNSINAKLVSVNGTDIIATYRGSQDIENLSAENSATKILRNGQVLILRGEKVYSIDGRLVR